jgi:hypothetical protein
MTSWMSLSLWNWFPFLQKIQFPWRWLGVASLAGAIIFVFGITEIRERWPSFGRPVAYGAVLILLTLFVFNISQQILPSAPLSREVFASQLETIDSKEGCSCWWPTWAKEGALQVGERVTAGSRVVEVREWEKTTRQFTVAAGAASSVKLATFYYPHWKATINVNSIPVEMDEQGAIMVNVPANRADVSIHFEEPWFLLFARWIALPMWIGLFGALGVKIYSRRSALSSVEPAFA